VKTNQSAFAKPFYFEAKLGSKILTLWEPTQASGSEFDVVSGAMHNIMSEETEGVYYSNSFWHGVSTVQQNSANSSIYESQLILLNFYYSGSTSKK
jgi:hypothetical protein